MWQEERQQKIRSRLAAFGQISIDRIVADFGVSRETIRRDLMEMERAGLLRRMRGGAVALNKNPPPLQAPFEVRHTQQRQEKQAIAAAVLPLLKSGMTIFMDAGSTMNVMAETLSRPNGLSDMTIITNSIDVACNLIKPESVNEGYNIVTGARFKVIMLGGEFKQNPMQMVGSATINAIHRYQADVALLAPWGINAEKGAFNYYWREAEIAHAMISNANSRILLADHSRIGAPSRFVFCPREKIDKVVTDKKSRLLPAYDALLECGVEVVVA